MVSGHSSHILIALAGKTLLLPSLIGAGTPRSVASPTGCNTSGAYADTAAVHLAANRKLSKQHGFPCFLHQRKQAYDDGPGQAVPGLGVDLQQDGQLQEDLVSPQ